MTQKAKVKAQKSARKMSDASESSGIALVPGKVEPKFSGEFRPRLMSKDLSPMKSMSSQLPQQSVVHQHFDDKSPEVWETVQKYLGEEFILSLDFPGKSKDDVYHYYTEGAPKESDSEDEEWDNDAEYSDEVAALKWQRWEESKARRSERHRKCKNAPPVPYGVIGIDLTAAIRNQFPELVLQRHCHATFARWEKSREETAGEMSTTKQVWHLEGLRKLWMESTEIKCKRDSSTPEGYMYWVEDAVDLVSTKSNPSALKKSCLSSRIYQIRAPECYKRSTATRCLHCLIPVKTRDDHEFYQLVQASSAASPDSLDEPASSSKARSKSALIAVSMDSEYDQHVYASMQVSHQATGRLVDGGCGKSMGSSHALRELENAMKKKGYHITREWSDQMFRFAGGGSSTRSAGKARVPVPALGVDTYFDSAQCPQSGDQTPLLWGIKSQKKGEWVHFTHQKRALVRRGDGVYVWVQLREGPGGHQFWNLCTPGVPADMSMTLADIMSSGSSQSMAVQVAHTQSN